MRAASLLLLLFFSLLPLRAQEIPAAQVTVAPAETREVVAEGRAAVGTGGIPAAREAAIAQALRSAVEKATGVFVSAHTLTSNYRLLQDEVTTHAAGFATLKEVLSERQGVDEIRVTIRALVSLRPLARRLKELNLTRAWRVQVVTSGKTELPTGMATLERTLSEAGFVVVSGADDGAADLVVRVLPKFATVASLSLETAAGPMTMHSIRSEITIRATRAGTGEVVSALSASEVAAHVEAATARGTASDDIMAVLAPRLADALMLLPASASQPVTLVISRLTRITQVGKLDDALHSLPGVRKVTRRSWERQVATWELDVTTEALPLLARALEEDSALRPFHLSVSSETRARITAAIP